MGRYLLRRVVYLVVQVFVIATLVFFLLRLVPGDPARAVLGETASDAQVAVVRHELGLDRPLGQQYITWMGNALQGNLGHSVISGDAVGTDIRQRIGNTLELIAIAVLVSLLAGMPLGIMAALRANHPTDFAISGLAMLGLSLPNFVVGSVFLSVFAVKLHWLPPSQFVTWSQNPLEHAKLLILPVLTLAATTLAVVMRMTRSSMLEVIRQDFIRTARSKGLTERRVVAGHALRNALNPVVSIVGLEITGLLGGTVIVETIYGWPGLSSLLLAGVRSRDYPVVQGVVLVIAVLTIVLNLAMDLTYSALDPRIRRS